MGKVLIVTGSGLCIAGVIALALTMLFLGKQRSKLINQINNEYREV